MIQSAVPSSAWPVVGRATGTHAQIDSQWSAVPGSGTGRESDGERQSGAEVGGTCHRQ